MARILTHREEDIVRNWLETTIDIFDRIVLAEQIQPIVDKFKNRFGYCGMLYRGISGQYDKNIREEIIDMPLASYTYNATLAREFRGHNKDSMIVRIEADEAFDLTRFLYYLLHEHDFYDYTNESMIQDRVSQETEVLYYFDKEMAKNCLVDEGVA